MNFEQLDGENWSYTSKDGDTVDLIAFNFYGRHVGTTELVLDGNPGLAAVGPVLSAGVVIKLPRFDPPSETNDQISLWD